MHWFQCEFDARLLTLTYMYMYLVCKTCSRHLQRTRRGPREGGNCYLRRAKWKSSVSEDFWRLRDHGAVPLINCKMLAKSVLLRIIMCVRVYIHSSTCSKTVVCMLLRSNCKTLSLLWWSPYCWCSVITAQLMRLWWTHSFTELLKERREHRLVVIRDCELSQTECIDCCKLSP